MTQRVKYYGLHTLQDEVIYLMQGESSGNFIGLTCDAPFEVVPEFRKSCPHAISIPDVEVAKEHWRLFQKILPDPLVREMLPIPKTRGAPASFFNDPANKLLLTLVTLSRMGSPVHRAVQPMSSFSYKSALEELAMTNITPLVLTGIKPQHQRVIEKLVDEALFRPRRLILLGDPTIVAFGVIKRETTNISSIQELELARLPMEAIGSTVLRQFARGEAIGGDLAKRKRSNLI